MGKSGLIRVMRKMLSTGSALPVAVVLLAGCGKFILKGAHEPGGGWPQLGQTPQRVPVVEIQPRFPLQPLWEKRASGAPGSSLVGAKDYILYGTQDGRLEGLHLENGDGIGKIAVRSTVEVTAALAGERLIIVRRIGKNNVICYDLTKAKTLWEKSAGTIPGEPLIVAGKIYLATGSGRLLALAVQDGATEAEYQMSNTCSATPAFANDRILIGDDKGILHALSAQLEPQWQYATGAAIRSPAVLTAQTAYVGSTDGVFYALDIASGSLCWKTSVGAKIYHPAALNDTLVFFSATDHNLYAVSRQDGDVKWRYNSGSILSTAPLLCGAYLFAGSMNKKFHALEIATGTVVWEFTAKGRIRGYPLAIDPYLVFSAEDDVIYCFRLY